MNRSLTVGLFLRPCLALLLWLLSAPCYAVTEYVISLVNPEQHLVEVNILLPEGSAQRQLQLPVWNALYQVRDFAQYVNWITATDRAGRPLVLRQSAKSFWQISGADGGAVIQYQIYANASGPFGAELNSHHAFFNLAEILMYPVEARKEEMLVRFSHIPDGWRIATPLFSEPDGGFSAQNYDRLVDSPVEVSAFRESEFDEGGGHYRVVIDADPGDYEMEKIVAMLHSVVVAATGWMNDRPFDSYLFIYHFPRGPAGGGMEHSYSTAIDVSAYVLPGSAEALTSVTAHEFFHLWNVKRIRPQTLEPVDYTKENYTRALWFSEGCTSTAADFIQLRSGALGERHFEQDLAAAISELRARPAHLTQSAEDSSLDAWLEGNAYYRRPERSISYYNKGELLGIALDLAVRETSHGQASLREVFEWMNENYAKKGRFFDDTDGVREAAEAVSHADLGWFFSKYVAGTEEIPWNDFFRSVGLRLMEEKTTVSDPGFVASRNFDGPMIVSAVNGGSAAESAGLQIGDTVLEINGKQPGRESSLDTERLKPGETVSVKIRNKRGAEHAWQWKMGSREDVTYDLKDMENITAEQHARRLAWLKGEAQSPQEPSAHDSTH
jgi:predicted metalloprotease with PDZ domain